MAAGFGLLLILVFAGPTIYRIYRNIGIASKVATAIASGDLSHPIPANGKDEVGVLIGQLSIMRNSLLELITAVRENVDAVMRSSTDLSSAANSSAITSESQSDAASGMASAMEELSASIDQVGQHAQDAREITATSGQQSEEGGLIIHKAAQEMRLIADTVNTASATIHELENFSAQIFNIVNVIKEIANQTNLLALNATIEAARAGEHGRGFAVVADEVRKLAENTTRSTQEISGMISKMKTDTQHAAHDIEKGVQRVTEGVNLANQAGVSITSISAGSTKISHAVDGITLTLKEQSSAARGLAKQVEQIAHGAEQNNSTVAQTATSALELMALAEKLNALTKKFRLA